MQRDALPAFLPPCTHLLALSGGCGCTIVMLWLATRVRTPVHLTHKGAWQDDNLKETLRDMSHARMGGWNNTLEARRRQKEADRQTKLDEEEKRRQVMDREEAAFQAAERKRCIQRANTLLYENTERVKAFGSKLYLSDVMKERELQMDIKRQIKERKDAEERMWHQRTIEAVKIGDMEEERKREERQQRALHAKQVQLDQLEDFRVRYVDAKRGEKSEGELIKTRVEMHLAEEARQEQEKKAVSASFPYYAPHPATP